MLPETVGPAARHIAPVRAACDLADSLARLGRDSRLMNLLIVSPTPTHPPIAGNRARILALTQYLKARGHHVHFFWIAMEDGDEAAMAKFFEGRFERVASPRVEHARVQRWRRGLLRLLGNRAAYQWAVDDWFDPTLLERLRTLARDQSFDVIIVEYVFLSRALEAWDSRTLKVIDTHDRFADRYRQYLDAGKRAEWFSTSQTQEVLGLSRADFVLAIQDGDAEYFRAHVPDRTRVETVGHLLQTSRTPHFSERPAAGLMASANWINVEGAHYFADSVLPHVRREIPEFELVVAGDLGDALVSRPGVRKIGRVRQPMDAYADTALAVNPVRRGTGLNIKTVECLALGLPLVTTRSGGRGLPAFADEAHVVVANDDPEDMARAIVELLRSPERRRALSARALEFAARWNAAQHAVLDRLFPVGP